MSACCFIASDFPLKEFSPEKDYPISINIEGDAISIDDGDADDNYFLKNFPDVSLYTDKKHGVSLEWRYTSVRAKRIIDYVNDALKDIDEVEIWLVWLLGDWEFDERPITYTALDTYMSKLADHYYETRVCVEFSKIYEFGCGMLSCPYCEGTVVRNYNPGIGIYSIEKYNRISDIRAVFEVCCVAFASLAIIGLISLIIAYVNRHKDALETDTTQTNFFNTFSKDDEYN